MPFSSSASPSTDPILGASILAETIAEMTYGDVAAAAGRGAVILWAFGVVEQHGPHLPTGTDIYIPSARLRLAKRFLAEHGIEALILPPYYWGVNHVSASFPASIKVRPEVMTALMSDVIESLDGDGFKRVFLVSGHGDALHNRTIFQAAEAASRPDGVQAAFVADPPLFARIDVDPASPHALATRAEAEPTHDGTVYADVHAGDWETSLMLALEPELVRKDGLDALPPTDLTADDLAEWRKGHDHARRVTPDGYLGDPASATLEKGAASIVRDARSIAEAIAARMAGER